MINYLYEFFDGIIKIINTIILLKIKQFEKMDNNSKLSKSTKKSKVSISGSKKNSISI